MMSSLSSLLILACPLGMAAMMGIPALWYRLTRRAKNAEADTPVPGLTSTGLRGW
jgi:hypothetical protein